jgi:hypothetical protein
VEHICSSVFAGERFLYKMSLERYSRNSLSLAKSSMVEKEKRRTVEGFYNFPQLLPLLINVNRNMALQT